MKIFNYFCAMKSTRLNIAKSFIKGIFCGKKKESVAMETYISCIPIIRKLIDNHKLGINLKERLVIIDGSLFYAFGPKNGSSHEINKSDKRLASFIDKIVAFMNFEIGRLNIKDFVDASKEPIHFHVTIEEKTIVDKEGFPVPENQQATIKTILIGRYINGNIDYKESNQQDNNQV